MTTEDTKEIGTLTYVVAVLWMHGRTINEIAKAVNRKPSVVHGITTRFFEKARGHLTQAERQGILDQMKLKRYDGGRLRDSHFVAAKIREDEIAPSPAPDTPPTFDLSTKSGRKKSREYKRKIAEAESAKKETQERREAGHNEKRGLLAAAFDYLDGKKILSDADEPKEQFTKDKSSSHQRRLEAGFRFRKHLDATRIGSLGAMDLETASMGGGGSHKLMLSPYQLEHTHALGDIRDLMSQMDYAMIEAVVDRDEFIWERFPERSRTRARIFDGIRKLLDIIAVYEKLMTREAFRARWDEDLPAENERVSRADAAKQSAAMANILHQAR